MSFGPSLYSLRANGVCHSESAATLEAESGYSMEEPQVERFREYILEGMWLKAEAALSRLGIVDVDNLWVSTTVHGLEHGLTFSSPGCQVFDK